MEVGESFEDCAIRETLEETSLELIPETVHLVHVANTIFPNHGPHYVTIFMSGYVKNKNVLRNTEPDKCEGWEWVGVDELGKLELFLPLKNLVGSGYFAAEKDSLHRKLLDR